MNLNPFTKNRPKLIWQKLKSKERNVPDLYRSAVAGGWLISSGIDGGLVFLPDAEHSWNGSSLTLAKTGRPHDDERDTPRRYDR